MWCILKVSPACFSTEGSQRNDGATAGFRPAFTAAPVPRSRRSPSEDRLIVVAAARTASAVC